MPAQRKSDFAKGLETIMNDPRTSPFTDSGAAGFKAVMSESGMSLSSVLSHLGKNKGKKPKGPTDAEKSAARTEKLEASTESN